MDSHLLLINHFINKDFDTKYPSYHYLICLFLRTIENRLYTELIMFETGQRGFEPLTWMRSQLH